MQDRAIIAAMTLCLCAPSAALGLTLPSKVSPDATPTPSSLTLPAGTPVMIVLEDDLSSMTSKVGDRFQISVEDDVVDKDTIVVPKGTVGLGEVTFVTNKGAFGKPGILGIIVDNLDLNGKTVMLDGHYREEGKDKDGVAGATMFAVGIFAGFVKGKVAVIPKGRKLKARTGEDIVYMRAREPAPAAPSQPVPRAQPEQAADHPAPVTATASSTSH